MPKLPRHLYCPSGEPTRRRNLAGSHFIVPVGDIKTVYFRKGRRWLKAGTLCLNCLHFVPFRSSISPDKLL